MGLGTLVSHFERTKLDSYLILYSKLSSRRIKELNVKLKPQGNQKEISIIPKYEISKKTDLITKRKTVGKTQHANLKGKLQTWKLLWYVRGAALNRGPGKRKLKWSTNSEHSSHHQECKWNAETLFLPPNQRRWKQTRESRAGGRLLGVGELSCAP